MVQVGKKQLNDLTGHLGGMYKVVHTVHPGRNARDGVAILLRLKRLELVESHPVDLLGKPYVGKWEGKG